MTNGVVKPTLEWLKSLNNYEFREGVKDGINIAEERVGEYFENQLQGKYLGVEELENIRENQKTNCNCMGTFGQ